jgi:hypothetical protein
MTREEMLAKLSPEERAQLAAEENAANAPGFAVAMALLAAACFGVSIVTALVGKATGDALFWAIAVVVALLGVVPSVGLLWAFFTRGNNG